MGELRNLYFRRSNGEYRLLAENIDIDRVYDLMHDFMDAHKFKCYYIRHWEKSGSGERWFDVGSHTEFFVWKKEN